MRNIGYESSISECMYNTGNESSISECMYNIGNESSISECMYEKKQPDCSPDQAVGLVCRYLYQTYLVLTLKLFQASIP